MADWTKSESADAIAHQEVTHPNTVEGSAISCVSDDAVHLILRWSSIEAAANTNSGSFLIQASDSTTGDENWSTIGEVSTPVGTSATANLDSGGEAIGQTIIGVSATASLVSKTWCYIEDTTTAADSEWCFIRKIVTNDTITILDGLTVAKDDNDDTWSDAQVVGINVDVHAYNRFRVVYFHEGTAGVNSAIWVTYSKATDFV